MHMELRADLAWAWRVSVLFFVLAGLTGFLFRLDLAYSGVVGLHLGNARHAHSHVMFFGWATPALMICMAEHLERLRGAEMRPASLRPILWWLFAFSALAYILFLMYGYDPVEIGGTRLPLSVIVSGLHVLGWYGFVVYYIRRHGGQPRKTPLLAFDLALALLILATLAAWGLALHGPLGLDEPLWLVGLTHFFLDTFSEGWLVLAVVGLAYANAGVDKRSGRVALGTYAFSVPFIYALAVPADLVPPVLKTVAKVAGFIAGISLMVHVWNFRSLARRATLWVLPIIFLLLKGAGQALVSAFPDAWWPEIRGLRVLYIHIMLLGFVTLGVSGAAGAAGFVGERWRVFVFQLAAVGLLLGIIPLTGLWPSTWLGVGTLRAAAWLSALPALCALLLLRTSATNRTAF